MNRTRNIFITILFSGIYSCVIGQKANNSITIGTTDTIYSKILNEKRTVQIHVPEGGEKEKFPVLYILDGESHFLSAVAITEQLSGVLPPMIVIGITNTIRERDLTPAKVNQTVGMTSGGNGKFLNFIKNELIPYVNDRYPAAGYRVFSGHSLGGLTVMNAFFNYTGVFNAYLALDPSLWWDDQKWIKKYEGELSKHDFSNKALFIAIANNIPSGLDTVSVFTDKSEMTLIPRSVIPFVHILNRSNLKKLRWSSKFYPNERHGTVELNAEYDGLRYLFDYYQFRTSQFVNHPELNEDSVLTAHYKMVSEQLGYKMLPPENTVNELAYDCMNRKKYDVAYKLFKNNIADQPGSSNAYDSLGDFYGSKGDKVNAIDAYTKALSINENADTRKKLNEWKAKP